MTRPRSVIPSEVEGSLLSRRHNDTEGIVPLEKKMVDQHEGLHVQIRVADWDERPAAGIDRHHGNGRHQHRDLRIPGSTAFEIIESWNIHSDAPLMQHVGRPHCGSAAACCRRRVQRARHLSSFFPFRSVVFAAATSIRPKVSATDPGDRPQRMVSQ